LLLCVEGTPLRGRKAGGTRVVLEDKLLNVTEEKDDRVDDFSVGSEF
jgi:hypothetical protein